MSVLCFSTIIIDGTYYDVLFILIVCVLYTIVVYLDDMSLLENTGSDVNIPTATEYKLRNTLVVTL